MSNKKCAERKQNIYPEDCGLFGDNSLAIAHWGFEELYPAHKSVLMDAIENKRAFDTGWCGTTKEFAYMRIQSNGSMMKLSVSQSMDDWPEIVGDCEGGDTLTEEEIDKLEMLADACDFASNTSISTEIAMEPFEKVMARICKMNEATNNVLEEHFKTLQYLVNQIVQNKQLGTQKTGDNNETTVCEERLP